MFDVSSTSLGHYAEVPPIGLVPIVCNFLDVFLMKLPGIPLDCDIEFCINLKMDIHSISIPPYRMELSELREFKVRLHDLLSKDLLILKPPLGELLCYL